MSLRAVDAIGIAALQRLLAEGNPVEANFCGRLPIIEYWDSMNCVSCVLVVYAHEADRTLATEVARASAQAMIAAEQVPCGVIASVCGADLTLVEVDDV